MKMKRSRAQTQHWKGAAVLTCAMAAAITLTACGGGSDNANANSYTSDKPFQVGTNSYDANLPAEPSLPTDAQVCATVYAQPNTIAGKQVPVVSRPDGSLPPEADPSVSGNGVATLTANPDQARIQAALNACGASVDAEVGAKIQAADAAATAGQTLAGVTVQTANKGTQPVNIAGVTGEELAKSQYKASKFAVRLVVSQGADGSNGFISGPLTLPSGVTLWIDKGVTLYASRDATAYLTANATKSATDASKNKYCANTANVGSAGSSSNCQALINGNNMVNSAVVGDGRIDSRGYAEIVTSNPNYPLLKVDGTCSNTYANYILGKAGSTLALGTPCDNGGTVVDTKSVARNMTWWDLAFKGNMVDNGTTGAGSQSNFRMMVFNYAKNLTLYRITLNNSANFHVVPSGVDGLTVWGVKVQTPSLAAFANPAGNGNPLYNGQTFTEDNVKNTDAFDPGAASSATQVALVTGGNNKVTITSGVSSTPASTISSSTGKISFDGYLKNFAFVYNYVSTGDDDIALKGSNNPTPGGNGSGLFSVDGNRDVRSDRKWGIIIAHNHIYWGHGISVGSETNAGVTNVQVYDNVFENSEEGLRIKSDYARGGEVSNITYTNICIKNAQNALLFTPYYSTKAIDTTKGVLYPNFHDITLNNVRILGASNAKLQGFAANSGGYGNPAYPLTMTLNNVVADSGTAITMSAMSDANLTIKGVNLPIFANASANVTVNGLVTQAVDPSKVVDCSNAFVDFPAIGQSNLFGSTWAAQ